MKKKDPFGPRIVLERVDSTNREVRRRREAGASLPFVIRAEEQFDGRGRGGNAWLMGPGNLAFSAALSLQRLPPPELATLPLVVALGARDGCLAVLGPSASEALSLKWPNDLMLDGKKLGGILCEIAHGETQAETIIGVGVNVAGKPAEGTRMAPACLADLKKGLDAHGVMEHILAALRLRLDQWIEGGFSAVKADYEQQCYGVGNSIVFEAGAGAPEAADGSRRISGKFLGITGEGHILIREPNGRQTAFAAGEVSQLCAES